MGLFFENIKNDLLTILVILISISYYVIHRKLTYWRRHGIPSANGTFPFGSYLDVVLQKCSIGDAMTVLYNKHRSERFIGIYTGLRPDLLFCDPELIKTVFIKDFAHFHDRGFPVDETYDPLSGNLFSLRGDKWRVLRGKLTPTFTSGKLKAMFSTLIECGGPLQNYMDEIVAKGETIEIREVLAQFMTNIIASVAFGINIDCIGKPDEPFRKYGRKIFEPSLKNGIRDAFTFLFPKLSILLKIRSVEKDIENFMISVVKQNMEHREMNNVTRKDFFQLLVQLRNTGNIQMDDDWETKIDDNKKLSIEEVAAQSFVFFAAGFETSSNTMGFFLYSMAKNKNIQKRVQLEIDETLKAHSGSLTYEAINAMTYLESCIDETLRMYSPANVLNRECTKDWIIPDTNICVTKGTNLIIPVNGLHYDERFYPEPTKFTPERFDTEKKFTVEKPYLPFGDGPRNCVGIRMGKMQTKVGLVILLQKYSFELAGNTLKPLVMEPGAFVLTPIGGLEFKVFRR